MGSYGRSPAADPSALGGDGKRPYVRLHGPTVFVQDMDRSLAFYSDQLGFRVAVDNHQPSGRWAAVLPPNGTGVIALAQPTPESEEFGRIYGCQDLAIAEIRRCELLGEHHPPAAPKGWQTMRKWTAAGRSKSGVLKRPRDLVRME